MTKILSTRFDVRAYDIVSIKHGNGRYRGQDGHIIGFTEEGGPQVDVRLSGPLGMDFVARFPIQAVYNRSAAGRKGGRKRKNLTGLAREELDMSVSQEVRQVIDAHAKSLRRHRDSSLDPERRKLFTACAYAVESLLPEVMAVLGSEHLPASPGPQSEISA